MGVVSIVGVRGLCRRKDACCETSGVLVYPSGGAARGADRRCGRGGALGGCCVGYSDRDGQCHGCDGNHDRHSGLDCHHGNGYGGDRHGDSNADGQPHRRADRQPDRDQHTGSDHNPPIRLWSARLA